MERPEVRFARAANSTIAYLTYGEGDVTVCAVPPMAQNIDLAWESPRIRAMFERFGSFSRQVAFDKRGTGMSDRSLDIPALDERVDELSAVMDAAGVDRAFVHGLSEGGPMAIMFAATYPERVDGLILEGTAASLLSDEQRAVIAEQPDYQSPRMIEFVETWGTPESKTLSIFSPSLLEDADFADWWPRYERHAASRDALTQLFRMNAEMDARDVVQRVECPVLILHRTGDRVADVEQARATFRAFEDAGADVRMVEFPGDDHYTFAGDMHSVVDEIERFTTGRVRERPAHTARTARQISIHTMGRFEVLVDGEGVPTSDWGSKRARTLLKRLVVARGWPVTRDELFEVLWPGELSDRLGARLSVQLSAVRRVLRGGVIADRSSIRLDLDHVDVDIERWWSLDDDADIVDRFRGELLPDDRYDDWSAPVRDEMRDRFVAAARRLVDSGRSDDAPSLLRRIIELDPFDEHAHRELVGVLHAEGRHGEAATAHQRYTQAMTELGIAPGSWDELTG